MNRPHSLNPTAKFYDPAILSPWLSLPRAVVAITVAGTVTVGFLISAVAMGLKSQSHLTRHPTERGPTRPAEVPVTTKKAALFPFFK